MKAMTAAAEVLRREAKRTESLVQAAAELERIGSLENAVSEAETLLATRRSEITKVDEELADAREKLKKAKIDASAMIDDAKVKAQRQADEITNKAAADAQQRTDAAVRSAEGQVKRRNEAIDEYVSLQEKIKAMQADADAVEKRLASAQAALDRIRDKVTA